MIRDRRGQAAVDPLLPGILVCVIVTAIVMYEVVASVAMPTAPVVEFVQQIVSTIFVTWRAVMTFGTGDWRALLVWFILSPILYPLLDAYVLQKITPGPHY